MDTAERKRMLNIPLCNQNMLRCLNLIGIQKLKDLQGKDPEALVKQINEIAGHKLLGGPIPRMALANLVAAADEA